MAKNNNLNDFLTDIANSIRTKKGTTGTINAQNFSSEIASIETGITPTGSIDITSNGTVDVTNYASANVNVANQNPYTATNATEMAQYLASKYYGAVVKYTGTTGTYTQNRLYKVIQVTSNEYTFEELITPVGSITKTENGTYDVKEYAEVVVNVPSGSGGNTLKNLLDATKSTYYLFRYYTGTSVDDLIQPNDTENVTNMYGMFQNCYNLITVQQLNTSNVNNMSYMFSNCPKLTAIPLLNTSNVVQMLNIFSECKNLTTIPQLDTSNVTSMNNMFRGCSNLKSILMTNIGANLDISASTQFERTDLVTILNNLKTVTSTNTLTMGATNLAKLTDEDKAIATNKGWTLA